jgi:hypothetical protein
MMIPTAAPGPEQSSSGWDVRWVLLARQGGSHVVRSVTLEPSTAQTPAGGVTSNLLRELSPTLALGLAQGGPESHADEVMIRATELVRGVLGPDGPPERTSGTPGRPPVPELELVKVALLYLHELRAGAGLMNRLEAHLDLPAGTIRDCPRVSCSPPRSSVPHSTRHRRNSDPDRPTWPPGVAVLYRRGGRASGKDTTRVVERGPDT